MDIDLLWIRGRGGFFLLLLFIIHPLSAASTKLLPQSVRLLLFLVVLVINFSWTQPYRIILSPDASVSLTNYRASGSFKETYSLVGRKLLLSSSTHHNPQPAMALHSNQTMNPSFASPSTTADMKKRAFRAAAHEVPSGPNPESNK